MEPTTGISADKDKGMVKSTANTTSKQLRDERSMHRGTNFQRSDFHFIKSDSKEEHDSPSDKGNQSLFGSKELKTAIRDFTVKANYSFWSDLKREEARYMTIEHRTVSLSSEFVLDLARFEMDVDSPQFFILTNVTRNVLLEPPPKLTNKKRTAYTDGYDDSYRSVSTTHGYDTSGNGAGPTANAMGLAEEEDGEFRGLVVDFDQDILMKEGLKITAQEVRSLKSLTRDAYRAIYVLVDHSLSKPLEVEDGLERDVRVTIGEGTWILRTDDDAETVTTSFKGVEAQFKYHNNRQSESYFTVQRFSVVRTDLLADTETWVIRPNVVDMEPCVRCNRYFKMEENHAHACGQHINSDGTPGVYKEVEVVDPLTGVTTQVDMWSCCGVQTRQAPFCQYNHHQFKEKMLQVNAMANPKTRVENIDVTVLTEIDISVFPGAQYDLQLQLSSSLKDVFITYFSLSGDGPGTASANSANVNVIMDGAPTNGDTAAEGALTDSALSLQRGSFGIPGSDMVQPHAPSEGTSADNQPLHLKVATSPKPYTLKRLSFEDDKSCERTLLHQTQELDPTYITPTSSKHYQQAVIEHMQGNNLLTEKDGVTKANVSSEIVRSARETSSENSPTVGARTGTRGSPPEPAIETDVIGNFKGWNGENSAINADHAQGSAPDKSGEVEPEADGLQAEAGRTEVLFIRRMRMGGLKASINTTGFSIGLNFKNLLAEVDSYTIHGEALVWRDLAYRIISHMGWSVARHATTSRISKLFGSWGSSTRTDITSMVLTNNTHTTF